ncbi:outer membrane beta-barrel family protein [Asticcacaulis sp. MM231]|uniref:outer membrane beta-barrel family protein n=1 Tax=Asticcacaulis sp. MM231 TaxID=3157666 RepID=UPI0032D581DE
MRKTFFTTTGLGVLILGGYVSGVTQSLAQEAPPAAAPAQAAEPPADPTTTVTVTGKKPQNKIDRQVYDNTKDIDSATGTAADALNKVPSVNVDPTGNVTLRGNSNVQVYIDGKPSVMMQGDNRAGALQSMSSGDIDSVEVMTNPGAQFSSEGSGGIINLVMRKNRKPGNTGAFNANVGDGRYNASINGARNSGKYTISGGLNIRHDVRPSRSGSVQSRLDANGDPLSTTEQVGASEGKNDNISANAGIDYNLSDKDQIGAQTSYSRREMDNTSDDTYALYNADGDLTSGYTRHSAVTGPRDDFSFGVRWDHTGDLTGETLKTDLRLGRSTGNTATDALNYPTDGSDTTRETRKVQSDFHNAVLTVDYVRPFGGAQMTTGFQITQDDNSFNNTATGPDVLGVPATDNDRLTNSFAYKQTISAAYMTWQTPIGEKWIVMGGLRAEALDLDTQNFGVPGTADDTTSHISYTKFNPSAFATYTLNDTTKLRFSYSHRLQRPSPQDLNPFQTYQDPQNVSAGNTDLKPAETDSFEAGYEKSGKVNYQIRAYYRKTEDSITSYSYFLPVANPSDTPVLLTTKRNLGSGEAGGLEGNFDGKLSDKISVRVNANLAWNKLTTPTTGEQEATTLSGRVSMDYNATTKDRFQISYFGRGKQLTGQGYTGPFGMGNMSYRHQYTPKAALVVTVQDPFRTAKFRTVVDTDSIHSESYRSLQGQVFMVGLSYTLGGPSTQKDGDQQRWNGPRGPGGPGGGWGGPGGGPM